MKKNILMLLAAAAILASPACSDEEKITPSEDLGFVEKFLPDENEDPRVLAMYEDYGLWLRIEFTDPYEVYNSYLVSDKSSAGQYPALAIDPQHVESAITYAQTFMSHNSAQFTKKFFPQDFWMLKSYGWATGYYAFQFRLVGRNRMVMRWPNATLNALPDIVDPVNHYYQDSVVTANVWNYFAQACAQHMEDGLPEFSNAGKAYDNGEAATALSVVYSAAKTAANALEPKDESEMLPGETLKEARERIRAAALKKAEEYYNTSVDNLLSTGGFVTVGGANSFSSDFSGWIRLLAMESYENIKADYLDNSSARMAKYEVITTFLKSYGWDIHAAGNKYRLMYDEYLASLPEPEPEP